MDKLIKQAKKIIDMPYNKFNLENKLDILIKYGVRSGTIGTHSAEDNGPIYLMSGKNNYSGIVITPWLKQPKGKTIYLIGKGVLFDSGGLNLKKEMSDMYTDKAGMVTALAVASYVNKGNVVAYCPTTTNFIQSSLITPGDVLDIGGKLVKISDTDAEGRLILAEALKSLYVSKNDIIITIATLTGCCEYAVDKATGVFSDNPHLVQKYLKAAEQAKELAWHLPMFDYMQKVYNKPIIKNYNKEIKAGASEGAMFIKQFVQYPKNWIHLDIASSSCDKNGKATGVPIKSLINFVRSLQ
jgi:leucyl aminopeptidase